MEKNYENWVFWYLEVTLEQKSSKGDRMNGQQGGKTELVCGILDAKKIKVFQGRKQSTMSNTLFIEVEK